MRTDSGFYLYKINLAKYFPENFGEKLLNFGFENKRYRSLLMKTL